jgi:putative ABC transport system permease protein
LEEGRNILMSNRLREKYRLREGDTIALNLNRGVRPYNIIGFFDTNKNNGECALISHRYLKLDTGVSFYTHIYIKTSKDPKEVVHEIQTRFPQRLMNIKTSAQIMTSTIKSYESLFLILRGFLVLALLIGIVGMINNLLISLLSRRRSLAMLRSLGMAQAQIVWMLLLEAVTAGSLGGFMGIVAGMGMVSVMPYVLEALNNPVKIRCDGVSMTAYVVFGMLILAGVSLVPMRKASKWSIIDSIREE